ncbi:MAG: GDYXXLXY domain-containing protein [Pseudomonadales bacterium]
MPESELSNPWYLRLLQGFAGWLAALFIFGFIGITLIDVLAADARPLLLGILGALNTAIAYFIFKHKKHDFTQQLALAFNLCGQFLFSWCFAGLFKFETGSYFLAMLGLQVTLALLLPNFLSRVLSCWFAGISLLLLLNTLHLGELGSAVILILFCAVWLRDLQWAQRQPFWLAVGYGLTLCVLLLSNHYFNDEFARDFSRSGDFVALSPVLSYWLNQALIALLLGFLLWHIAKPKLSAASTADKVKLVALGVLLIAIGHLVTGASGALILLAVGQLKQRRMLSILGALSLIGFISWYYYNLDWTLFHKSMVLLGLSGAMTIAAYTLYMSRAQQSLNIDFLRQKYRFNRSSALVATLIVLVLGAVNFAIYQKEQVLSQGQSVLLKLAPVDPRSLMQGDYMRLRFDIESTLLKADEHEEVLDELQQALFVVELDEQRVASYVDLYRGQTLQANQVKMQFRIRSGRIRLATHAFFFEEGSAAAYEAAEYGEFRVAKDGELLLNSMVDKDFAVIGHNRPQN